MSITKKFSNFKKRYKELLDDTQKVDGLWEFDEPYDTQENIREDAKAFRQSSVIIFSAIQSCFKLKKDKKEIDVFKPSWDKNLFHTPQIFEDN